MKYSDLFVDWLYDLGYRACFYVGGGNIMHLVDSFHKKMHCIPCVHEVACGIAAEYYNQVSLDGSKAVALVTAGPGLTNVVTAISAAFLENRELLIIGGQVKVPDLSKSYTRQRGIQEGDGISVVKSITNASVLVDHVFPKRKVKNIVSKTSSGRPGPVFFEFCLDIQGTIVTEEEKHHLEKGALYLTTNATIKSDEEGSVI